MTNTTTTFTNLMAGINNAVGLMEDFSVYTSGFIAPAIQSDQTYTLTTTTGGTNDGSGWITTIPSINAIEYTWMDAPNLPNTFTWPPIQLPPDLDALEEGVHPIKGGKVIIKKVMVEDDEMDEALREAFAAEEEQADMHEKIEEMMMSEEREV
jgi:hypothetical protein